MKNRTGTRTGGVRRFDALIDSTRSVINAYADSNRDGTPASAHTIRTTSEVLVAAVTRIWHMGFHLEDVRDLKSKHIYALAQNWIDTGYKRTTILNSLCRLRRLGDWIGDPSLVDDTLSAQIKIEFQRRGQTPAIPEKRSIRHLGAKLGMIHDQQNYGE